MTNNEILAFYSSDARPLYKADIFKAMSLPDGYTLHFRYQSKYIAPDVLTNISKIKNKEGVIIFRQGNEIPDSDNSNINRKPYYKDISIRKIKVIDVIYDDGSLKNKDNTLLHFYLSLSYFVDCTFKDEETSNSNERVYFLKNMEINKISIVKWINRVEAIKEYFSNISFFYIKSLKKTAFFI